MWVVFIFFQYYERLMTSVECLIKKESDYWEMFCSSVHHKFENFGHILPNHSAVTGQEGIDPADFPS